MTTATEWALFGSNGREIGLAGPVWIGESGPIGLFGAPPESDIATGSDPRLTIPRGDADDLPRVFSLPIVIAGTDEAHAWRLISELTSALSPRWGDCRFVAQQANGGLVDLVATPTSGLTPNVRDIRDGIATMTVVFRAIDPYWRSQSIIQSALAFPVTGSGAERTPWNWDGPWNREGPWNGFRATDADSSAAVDLSVAGTAPTWPTFTIEGPASAVSILQSTPGVAGTFSWVGELDAGQTLFVDFDKANRVVTIDGATAWRGLADASQFWRLRGGIRNALIAQVDGAATTTTCTMSYRPRLLTPA